MTTRATNGRISDNNQNQGISHNTRLARARVRKAFFLGRLLQTLLKY